MEGLVTILLILTGINTLELLYRVLSNKNAKDIIDLPYMSLDGTRFEDWLKGRVEEIIRKDEDVQEAVKSFQYPVLYFDKTKLSEYIQDGVDAKIEELAEVAGFGRNWE